MSEMIRSKNPLFAGQLVRKPLEATVVGETPDGEPIYRCPNCKAISTVEECDVIGAEPGCLFCNKCNLEFKC